MIILGIDPGLATIGYGFVKKEGNKFNVLDYGCIYTSKDDSIEERLVKIYDELDLLVKLYKPCEAAVEDLFFFKNQKTVITVAEARGVILLALKKNDLKITSYTPLQVKMGLTGYGRADKKQIQLMVQRLTNLQEIPKPDDAADAIAVALTHINSMGSILESGVKSYSKIEKIPEIKNGKISAKDFRDMLKGRH